MPRPGQRQPGECRAGRAAAGPGLGAAPAPRGKPGFGRGGVRRRPGSLPAPGRRDGPSRQGRAVRYFREWAGDESPATGALSERICCCCWVGIFNLLTDSASVTAHSSLPPPLPVGIAAGGLGSRIQMCLSGHTARCHFWQRSPLLLPVSTSSRATGKTFLGQGL